MEQATGMMFAGGVGLLFYGIFALVGVIALGLVIFWIWMIIDCAKRPFPQPEGNQRLVWILVIVLVGWIGALIYLFAIKIPEDRKSRRSIQGIPISR